MVLFLIKDHEKGPDGRPGKVVWRPAARSGGMKVSVAWIEKDRVYAFVQRKNPGSSQLIPQKATEKEFRQYTETVVMTRTELLKALSQSDSSKLTESVLPLLKTESVYLRVVVIEKLPEAGSTALPALRKILQDDRYAYHHDDAIEAMARAGGAAVGPELSEMLKEELAFWKKAGPDLKKGWWNAMGKQWEETLKLRNRYSRTHAVLLALQVTKPPGSKDTVASLRDFWRSLPQLAEIDQMAETCDKVLTELSRPVPATPKQ